MDDADLFVVLTDDWELRGDGRGDVETLQRTPALRLMGLYERHGLRSTFNLEVMQQLAFERYAARDAHIARQRDLWKQTVGDFLQRGFDVQLHLHPQWYKAELKDDKWIIGKRWNIVDYERPQIEEMVDESLGYLTRLVGADKILAFRGGSWGMGPPSRSVVEALLKHRIRVDMSVVKGSYYRGECISLDYRELDSPYEPYHPDYDDIRRVSKSPNALLELPTQSVAPSEIRDRLFMPVRRIDRVTLDRVRRFAAARILPKLGRWAGRGVSSLTGKDPGLPQDPFGLVSGRARTDFVVDLSLDYRLFQFRELVDRVVERALKWRGTSPRILVFTNHSKDLQTERSFGRIDALLHYIKRRYPFIRFETVTAVWKRLQSSVS